MKILTTQNLNHLRDNQPTVSMYSNAFRLKEQDLEQANSEINYPSYAGSLAFKGKGKKPTEQDYKKIIKFLKEKIKVGEINTKDPQPEKKRGDKFMQSSFFDRILKVADYENAFTAIVAAVACVILRPATIGILPTKKNKNDNRYAQAHSVSSGLTGLITTVISTLPFKKGANHASQNLIKEFDPKALKRLHPHLNENSIWKDASKTVRAEMDSWLDIYGNKFSRELKNVDKLPELKFLNEVSEKTFKDILKVDVDWAAQKGKYFNDVVTKDGKKLVDVIDMSRLGIVVEEGNLGKSQILLKDLDKNYLEKLIADSKDLKGSNWGELDINTVYKDGKVQDFREWKKVGGEKWELDLDTVGVSSPYETANYVPRRSGDKRFDENEKVYKYSSYQFNGVDGGLGTKITEEMAQAEERNKIHDKLITWLPDIIVKVPMALLTIALIPKVVKHVFGLEKSSSKPQTEEKEIETASESQLQPSFKGIKSNDDVENAEIVKQLAFKGNDKDVESAENKISFKGNVSSDTSKPENISFKGNEQKSANWLTKKIAQLYGKKLLESKIVSELCDKFRKMPGDFSQHMMTLGSVLTSSIYVGRTLRNKEIEPDRRRTLAVNQGLCCVIPAITAYTIDNVTKSKCKDIEYRYSGLMNRKINLAESKGKTEEAKKLLDGLGRRLIGIRVLSTLITSTLIYRYFVPVLFTPLANKIGDAINDRKKAKQEAEQAKVAVA